MSHSSDFTQDYEAMSYHKPLTFYHCIHTKSPTSDLIETYPYGKITPKEVWLEEKKIRDDQCDKKLLHYSTKKNRVYFGRTLYVPAKVVCYCWSTG